MKRIFAGIVFIFVNLEIFSIDVLPNFVGYILLILGVRELLPDSKINRAAQGLLAVGGLVHLAAQVYGVVSSFSAGTQQLFNIAASIPTPNPFFAVGLPMLISVVTLLLFWAVPISLILQGISQLEGVEKSDMSTINIAWVISLVAAFLSYPTHFLPMQFEGEAIPLIFVAASLIAMLVFILFLSKLQRKMEKNLLEETGENGKNL